jgi:hypothetical protein
MRGLAVGGAGVRVPAGMGERSGAARRRSGRAEAVKARTWGAGACGGPRAAQRGVGATEGVTGGDGWRNNAWMGKPARADRLITFERELALLDGATDSG